MELKLGYKLTDVGAIPEDWELRGLLEAAHIASGQVDPRVEPFKSMFLIAPDHIESGTGRLLVMSTAADQRAISGKYLFTKGDVIYSKIRPYLKKAILAKVSGLCSADMYPLKPTDEIVGAFLLYILLGYRFTKYAESVSVRSGMPKINRVELADFKIALPPRCEQCAIVEVLSDVDAQLNGMNRLIAKKHDIKQAAMQQLLSGQTRLPGFDDDWEPKRLGNHLRFLRNGAQSRAELAADGSVKYLHYGDIHTTRHVRLDPHVMVMPSIPQKRAETLDRLNDGDVVFVDASEDLDGVGKSVEVGGIGGVEMVAGQHTIAARFDKSVLVDGFKAYLQFCPPFREHLRRLAAGTKVYATTRAHIASVEMCLPSPAEQHAVAAVLSDMDAELAALEVRREKTLAIKQATMQELLTGKTRLMPAGDPHA